MKWQTRLSITSVVSSRAFRFGCSNWNNRAYSGLRNSSYSEGARAVDDALGPGPLWQKRGENNRSRDHLR
jgi:hypothetical protein